MTNSDFFSNFYLVLNPNSKKNYLGRIVNQDYEFGTYLRNETIPDFLDIEYSAGGNEPKELFWNSVNDPFCISQNLIDIFKQHEIKGWSTIPTNVKTNLGRKASKDFFALTVIGRINSIDYLKSDIVFNEYPGGLFPYFKGLYFSPESWDGSDFFMERVNSKGKSTTFIFVTKKVVDIFKKYKIKNIRFTNFNEVETSCGMIKIGSTNEMIKKIDEKIEAAKL